MKIFLALYLLLLTSAYGQETCRGLLLDIYSKHLPVNLYETKKVHLKKGVYLWIDSLDLDETYSELIKIEYIETLKEVDKYGNITEFSLIKRLDAGELIKYEMAQALGNFVAATHTTKRELTMNEIIGLDSSMYKTWKVIEGNTDGDIRMLNVENARYLKSYDEVSSLVKISKYNQDIVALIPNKDIRLFQNAGEEDFLRKLEGLLKVKINLDNQIGKLIRYRKNGKVEVDILEKIEGVFGVIKSGAEYLKVPLEEIYIISHDYINIYTPKEARINGHIEALSEMSYQFEQSPLTINFLNGAGVCRHKAALLMILLKETGFREVSIGVSPSTLNNPGHAWVEIAIDGEKYILDTSNNDSSLKDINEINQKLSTSIKKISELDFSNSFTLRHYLNS